MRSGKEWKARSYKVLQTIAKTMFMLTSDVTDMLQRTTLAVMLRTAWTEVERQGVQ